MIQFRFIYTCDKCGAVRMDPPEETEEYEEILVTYPNGWLRKYKTGVYKWFDYCPKCAREALTP